MSDRYRDDGRSPFACWPRANGWIAEYGRPRHGRWRPLVCQFIAGEPTPDDGGKCGRPVRPGSSFCAAHHARCWSGRIRDGDGSAGRPPGPVRAA